MKIKIPNRISINNHIKHHTKDIIRKGVGRIVARNLQKSLKQKWYLKTIKGQRIVDELLQGFGVQANQINTYKKHLI